MKTYRMTTAGRRLTFILMLAAVALWVFAIFTLQTTLGIRYLDLRTTFGDALRKGFGASQLIPAAILLTMVVAAPLLFWNLCEEWVSNYSIAPDGLIYRTLPGITLHYPWSTIQKIEVEAGDDGLAKLQVTPDAIRQIRNPLARWLHRQTFGGERIPIYAGVEARDELLAMIAQQAGLEIIQRESGTETVLTREA